MKTVYTRHFPPGRYIAINLFGVLFTKRKPVAATVLNHESIHTAQMRELCYVGFYALYVLEFAVRLLLSWRWHRAYRAVSFEREAYLHQSDPTYAVHGRRPYAWVRFLWGR